MIPYVHISDFHVLGIALHPFGLLVAVAVLLGTSLATRRARRLGLDLDELNTFITWMLVAGFIGGHVIDEILYRPHDVLQRPWSLLLLWEGMGSFSGWLGALIGVVLWKFFEWRPRKLGPITIRMLARRKQAMPILPFADLILAVFPVAWIFGRIGCAVVHDHPGARAASANALAVAYPSANAAVIDGPGTHWTFGPITLIDGHFPRYDMGTLELFFTIVLALIFALAWRKRLALGTYAVAASLAYPPVRFAMEFLRMRGEVGSDPRYAGLTPAQWMCMLFFVFGLALLRHVRTRASYIHASICRR